jgi:hypothetical protein
MKLRIEGCRFPSWRAWPRCLKISHAYTDIVGFGVALDNGDVKEEREMTALVSAEVNTGLGSRKGADQDDFSVLTNTERLTVSLHNTITTTIYF